MKRVFLKLIMVTCFSSVTGTFLTALPLFISRWNSENVGMSFDDFVFGLIPVAYLVIGSVLGTSAIAFPAARVLRSESLSYSVIWAAIVGLCSTISYIVGIASWVGWLVFGSVVHLGAILPLGVALIAAFVVIMELVLHLLIKGVFKKSEGIGVRHN